MFSVAGEVSPNIEISQLTILGSIHLSIKKLKIPLIHVRRARWKVNISGEDFKESFVDETRIGIDFKDEFEKNKGTMR